MPVGRGAASEFGEEFGAEAVQFRSKQGGDAVDNSFFARQREDAGLYFADALYLV